MLRHKLVRALTSAVFAEVSVDPERRSKVAVFSGGAASWSAVVAVVMHAKANRSFMVGRHVLA